MTTTQLYELFRSHPHISTDSRKCLAGSLFFALKGDRFDGNDYIETALRNGAAYAIGDREGLPEDPRIICVKDVLTSLQEVARLHRDQLRPTVIAVTGTNGKTTTKELIATALSSRFSVLYTEGNLNNHIGVPLTLLRLRPEHRFAVIEMGANHEGEIDGLCRIADPDFGLITNIGRAHLEGFGSYEGVVRAKTELYAYLQKKGGTLFVNCDNRLLESYSSPLNRICYGTSPDACISGRVTGTVPTLQIAWRKEGEEFDLETQLAGLYNLENILAAICIASFFGVDGGSINRSIGSYIPSNNRSQWMETGKNRLLVDTYNANPSSMQVALENFFSLPFSPKMVILGEMRELGSYSEEEHRNVIKLLIQKQPERVILLGKAFEPLSPLPEEWRLFLSTADLTAYLQEEEVAGYTLLIKGSRGNRLEETVPFL